MEDTTIDAQDILNRLSMNFAGVIYPRRDYLIPLNIEQQDETSYSSDNISSTLDDRRVAFERIEDRISDISLEENEEDFIYKPTVYAFDLVYKIVKVAYLLSNGNIVKPLIGADGQGGLKFDWRGANKEVRLFIPGNNTRTPYLYHTDGTEDGIVDSPNEKTLAFWLTWLNK